MKWIALLLVGACSLGSLTAAPTGPFPRPTKVVDPTAYPPFDRTTQNWRCSLYGEKWTPFPQASFETDAFIQDFSYAGYRRSEVPLPVISLEKSINVVTDTGADPSGKKDSTRAIQKAIDLAATRGGGVVYLPEGLYRISPQEKNMASLQITNSNIVLKGAGSGKTFLLNTSIKMHGKQILSVEGPETAEWDVEESPRTELARDMMGPSMVIPVESTQGFAKGDWIVIRCQPTEAWILDHHETDWLTKSNQLGSILYYRQIESIDPERKLITIDAPTRYYLKKRDHPVLYKKTNVLEAIGIEGFSIGNIQHPGTDGWKDGDFANPEKSAYDVQFSFAIKLNRVRNSWIRDIESFQYDQNSSTCHLLSNGIRLRKCRAVTISNCHFQRTQYGGGGGNGYMFRLDDSNECLLENCIAESARHGYAIAGMACSGNVLYHCTDKDTGRQTAATGRETTGGQGSDHHMWFSHSNLYDTCIAENSWFEARYRYDGTRPSQHDITAAHTVFWNLEGKAPSSRVFLIWSQQARYGYVIGTRGAVPGVSLEPGCPPDRFDRTDPVDIVEGVGMGDRLQSFSLYKDQLQQRLSQQRSEAPSR